MRIHSNRLLLTGLIFHCGISLASVSGSSFLPISPDQSHPRFQFTESSNSGAAQFSVARGVIGTLSACPDSGETLSYDSTANISWCTRTAQAGSTNAYALALNSGVWTYTDKIIGLDDVDTREFKYSATLLNDSAGTVGW